MPKSSQTGSLVQFDHGVWKHTAPPMKYDGAYFEDYILRDASRMGEELTRARIDFVCEHYSGRVVDIGIGGGRFVQESGGLGFDVNSAAIQWLKKGNLWCDPYKGNGVDAVTCWDSLEHIPEPEALLNQVRKWIFVSLPIFRDMDHLKSSKHYKPGEHIWYFTHDGFVRWLSRHGFETVDYNQMETVLGRDGIYSYAARRR